MQSSRVIHTNPSIPTWERLRPKVTAGLLRAMVARLVEAFHPQKIVLFGSHARGTATSGSDLDLLVVLKSKEPIWTRMRKVAAVAQVPFLPMDVFPFTASELRKRVAQGDDFVRRALEEGKVLYGREPSK